MKSLILSSFCVLTLGLTTSHFANASAPVVIGDSSKGTPLTTIKGDDGEKVQISTSGITIRTDDDADDEKADAGTAQGHVDKSSKGNRMVITSKGFMGQLEDILVPAFFFMFLVAVILGRRYFDSRNEEKRLQLLKLMVERGQPVPEAVVNQILAPQSKPEADSTRQRYSRTRNSFGFTLAGLLLLGHAMLTHSWSNAGELVPALIFLCLGIGGLAGLFLAKRDEKIAG